MKDDPESISISEFKATCLARLERVRRTGRRLVVTRRGQPIAEVIPPSPIVAERWLGSGAPTARILGDLLQPLLPPDWWEAGR